MGGTQTKLAHSKVSETEKKHWWKRGKTHKIKKKTFEVHNGISQEYEEITEETKCENYTQFKRVEIKTVCNKSRLPVQERDSKISSLTVTAEMPYQTSQGTFMSKTISKHPDTDVDDYKQQVKSVYSNTSFDSGYKSSFQGKSSQPESREIDAKKTTFDKYNTKQKFEKQSKCEDKGKHLACKTCGCVCGSQPIRDVKHRETFDSSFPLLHSIKSKQDQEEVPNPRKEDDMPSGKTDKRKVSLNSLLDEKKSSISSDSSHTEMKTRVTDMIPDLENHECQSMEQLKLRQDTDKDDVSVKALKIFKVVDDTDDEESDSNITDVKEFSSSYPDTNLCSDITTNLCSDSDQLFTQSSEECISVSSYSSQRARADSTTLAKEVARYDLSETGIEKTADADKATNTYNIPATGNKKDTLTQVLSNIESGCNGTGSMINLLNGKTEYASKGSQSVVRTDKDEGIIKAQIQPDIVTKTSKESDTDEDLKAVMYGIYILINSHTKYGQETQNIVRNPVDFEVDTANKIMPSADKHLKAKFQTNKSDEHLSDLDNGSIVQETYETGLDIAEAILEVKDFPSLIVLMAYVLLYCKWKEEVRPELSSSPNVGLDIKVELENDAAVIYQKVKMSDSSVLITENTSDNKIDLSDECNDESVHRNIDECQSTNCSDRADAESKLSQSNDNHGAEMQLKETKISTETDHTDNATIELKNIETIEKSVIKNENHPDCCEETHDEVVQNNDDCMLANRQCCDIIDFERDFKGNGKETAPDDPEHQINESSCVENYIWPVSKAAEHDESKLKLSESVRRENGKIPRPIVISPEEETEIYTSSESNNSTFAYQNESSIDEYCNRTSVELKESEDRNNPKLDLNETLENEDHTMSAGENSDAHFIIEIEEIENNLIGKNADLTDLVKMNRKDEQCSDITAGNTQVSQFGKQKKGDLSLGNISRETIRIGSTKRDGLKGKQIKCGKTNRKSETILMQTLQNLPSEDSVYCSQSSSGNGETWQRKNKHRVRKKKFSKKKQGSASGSNFSTSSVEKDNEIQKTSKAKNFCQKCHQPKDKGNKNCSECRIHDGELGSGKFQYQVKSRDDSGISSLISSIRSSVLSELKSIHSIEITKLPKNKKRKKLIEKLGALTKKLREITKGINIDVLANADHDIVAFPGLQSYFDSLRNGNTPSLQERMSYEWLRLMTFSNYTGGGSPVHLARNGFYHSHNNETHCFCCNTSYSNWTYSDNVQEVHRRISPNCPLVNGGIESNGNISIESGTRDNQPSQAPANLYNATDVRQGASQSGNIAERPTIPTNHGEFAFGTAQMPNIGSQSTNTIATSVPPFSFSPPVTRPDPSEFRFPQTSNQLPSGVPNLVGQSAAAVTTSRATAFSFSSASNTPEPAGFRFPQSTSQQAGGVDLSSQLTGQLRALTIQQSTGVQQPSDEPISGNPVIAPTQPLQIARQADGDQLSISAQQPPETTDLPQNTARNQRPSEPSGSAPPAQRTENADLIQITQLKHPRYSTMAVRMSSFRSWPNYLNQTARQMAYAGFFHPGVADFARCFCCGGGLRNWEADDDPMVEHARWYPRCEYINKLKGTHFVQAVLRRHREHMAERQREQETAQNTFSTPDPMSTSVAANLLEMGFTQERAREAILTVRRLRERSEVSIEEVTAWMLDDGNAPQQDPAGTDITSCPGDTAGNAPPQPPRSQTPASSGSSSFESAVAARQDSDGHGSIEDSQGGRSNSLGSTGEPHGATGVDKKEDKPPKDKPSKTDSSSDEKGKDYSSDDKSKKDKVPDEKKPKSKKDKKSKSRKGRRSPVSGEGAAAAEVDTKSLKEENKLLKQMQVCKICMDKYVSVTFLPCGHLVCCEDCAKNMRKCPICRKRIKGQVRTFMS